MSDVACPDCEHPMSRHDVMSGCLAGIHGPVPCLCPREGERHLWGPFMD